MEAAAAGRARQNIHIVILICDNGEMKRSTVSGKDRLLEAAVKAFSAESYGQVGVAQILEEAGVQAPTLYHHYGDKEGLYVTWACTELAKVEARLSPISEMGGEASSALKEFASVLSQGLTFDVRQLLRDAERLQKPENKERVLGAYLQAVYNPLYAIIVRAIARNEIRREPIGLLAETFIAGALAVGKHGWRSSESSDEGAAWWTKMFLGGCGASAVAL